ncbi:hypothetical protein [Rhizobium laguerreae]|uniref:hypothetical protein n=1 Tax=Rhizobium laguerreae TaxID=1076926 RepID=UPI001C905B1D|nr:hypothetical protein [Rhizobium laguerreae]MBY3136546.1 hypothetical protein [Rhizobium laguerreae]
MIFRRQLLGALGAAPIVLRCRAWAQDDSEVGASLNDDEPPLLSGNADFAGVWEPIGDGGIVAAGPPPEIPKKYVELYSDIILDNARKPGRLTADGTRRPFDSLVNQMALDNPNADLKPFKEMAAVNLCSAFWDAYLGTTDRADWRTSVTLLEYITYIAVFLNETGGSLSRGTEKFNVNTPTLQHPGICYFFDRLQPRGASWWKKSYNGPPNRKCSELFTDKIFNDAHAARALGRELQSTTDAVWSGDTYPKRDYPTSGRPDEMGYILAADFFKFRGRGLIQTTWRSNYKRLVQHIQTYNGDNELILKYKELWSPTNYTSDEVCSLSGDDDWNELFRDPLLEIPVAAVKLHAVDGKYLPLSNDHEIVNSSDKGSIIFLGDRLGGKGYGARLRRRVYYICEALGTDLDQWKL